MKRAGAAVLMAVGLWLAPSSAFAGMQSHACMAPQAHGPVLTTVPHTGSAPCQSAQPFGCETGPCAALAAIPQERATLRSAAPLVALKAPADAVRPACPGSVPPTPPPNN